MISSLRKLSDYENEMLALKTSVGMCFWHGEFQIQTELCEFSEEGSWELILDLRWPGTALCCAPKLVLVHATFLECCLNVSSQQWEVNLPHHSHIHTSG